MGKKINILTETPSGFKRAWFFCPGCESDHAVYIEGDKSKVPVWGYNGSEEKPTFMPSIDVKWEYGEVGSKRRYRCHSFVKVGMIEFLGDCTHKLKGQTVELPDYKD